MESRTVKVTVTRYDSSRSPAGSEQTFRVPVSEGMSVLQALDYIYEHLDPTLTYYDHGACAQGICKRCLMLIDGEVRLACQSLVSADVRVAPHPRFACVKDLVYDPGRRAPEGAAGSARRE